MNYAELISDANLSFSSGNFQISIEKAKEAIRIAPNESEGYYCAGKAYMSMDQASNAVESFKKAVEIDKTNGNGFFLLGYAQAMNGESAKSLQSLTRAIECKCDDALLGQIYKIMSMINTEQEDYENALTNLQQAEEYTGLDYEILQQKAACFASLKDYHDTIYTLNQMKLLRPKDYSAYSLAFNIFMELGIYDEAKAELERAEKYASLTIAYYNDRIAYVLLHNPANDTRDNIVEKWIATLHAIDDALKNGRPTNEEVAAFEVAKQIMRRKSLWGEITEEEYADFLEQNTPESKALMWNLYIDSLVDTSTASVSNGTST